MRKQHKVSIKGSNFLITQMGGWEGLRVGRQVVKILGPAMVELFTKGEQGFDSATEVFLDNIDKFDDELVKTLVGTATKDGMAINFDDEFSGNYMAMVTLIKEVIWFNFQDLFTEALGDFSGEE